MTAILAIDQGTTGSTALVIHQDGRMLGRGYREFTQHFPQPGWVEHDPLEILRVTLDAAREAIAGAGEMPLGVGITNQRETVVLWDRRTLQPVAPAIVWQDRRTAARCRELKAAGHEALIRERTGLLLDPYFSATKVELLLQAPGLRRRAEQGELAAGTIDSWLIARLTGGRVHVTDHTNASRTLLYDLASREWDPALLSLFGIPRQVLPAIVSSAGVVGKPIRTTSGGRCRSPASPETSRRRSSARGACERVSPRTPMGPAHSCWRTPVSTAPARRRDCCSTAACGPRGEPAYALEGSVFIAGAAVQWLRDGLGLVARADETEPLARSVPDTGGVYFVPAFVGLGSPHWEPEARGTIVGLTRGTTRAHLVRAALEAMAFASADLLAAMASTAHLEVAALRVDGGATANDWLMQFQSEVLGVPVERPDNVETTALGAAALAGLALGVWPSIEAFLAGRVFTRFTPSADAGARERGWQGWRRAVHATLAWARHPG